MEQKIEKKWQDYWEKNRVFEPCIEKKEAFYIQPAYPYPSGAMHIGHARTYTVSDIVAKYNLLKGKNVLMPMGWHVSGTPVIATVEALQRGDKKTIQRFKENFNIPEKELEKLKTPEAFVDYMVNKAEYGYKTGFKKLGLGFDWRRELTTIDPQYTRFIQWQYKKLFEKGYIRKGKYPVRYCPKCKNPVGDHDLSEGEGIGVQEFVLLKLKLGNGKFLIAATLRPETIFGQTNAWVREDVEYLIIKVGGEEWIASNEFFEKYRHQNKEIKISGRIKGKELVGKEVFAPGIEKKIPVLPAEFCETGTGTGIVTSVPSDAPIDFIALKDVQENKKLMEKYSLNSEKIKAIKPVPIINTPGAGELPAVKAVEELLIKNQNDSEKLEKAKKEVYKTGFHKGEMNKNSGKFAGMQVSKAKELVKKELLEKGQAEKFFELEGRVECRCSAECVVRVLEDQWFVNYSSNEWKKEAKKTLECMKITPTLFKKQYEKVFEWLEDKPCTRSKGLGTSFPWQKELVIEPLGDSTVYMAYFTVAHLMKKVPAEKLSEKAFDFIFLGKGNAGEIAGEKGIEKSILTEMKNEFDYWYPLAFNASATELIPNHMSFSIFHHSAIFPKEKRQKGTLNLGMVTLEGKKLSSSKGNVVLVNDLCESIGSDFVRFFLVNAVEPWEEMNWQQGEVEKKQAKIKKFVKEVFKAVENSEKNKEEFGQEEEWFYCKINSRIKEYEKAMEKSELRRALQSITFHLMKDHSWYSRRKKKENKYLNYFFASEWAKCIAPFMPHIAEEIWQKLGNKKSVFSSQIKCSGKTSPETECCEELIKNILDDIIEIKKIAGIEKPKIIVIYTAAEWKQNLLERLVEKLDSPDEKQAIQIAFQDPEIRSRGKEALKTAKYFSQKILDLKNKKAINEFEKISSAKEFLEKELDCKVEVQEEGKEKFDPKKKAKNTMPFRPAIYLE